MKPFYPCSGSRLIRDENAIGLPALPAQGFRQAGRADRQSSTSQTLEAAVFWGMIVVVMMLMPVKPAFGFNYGEHKEIGDQGFNRLLDSLIVHGYYENHDSLSRELRRLLDMRYYRQDGVFIFDQLSFLPNYTSYGVLNALSGDHEGNVLAMNDNLRHRFSSLQRIINLHNQYIAQMKMAAPDMELQHVDSRYGFFALLNHSHFYNYGESFREHVETFKRARIDSLKLPRNVQQVFKELAGSNAINEYLTLHSFAIYLAEEAGKYYQAAPEKAGHYLFFAMLYNAFADHFLQDSFSAGHLGVNRTFFGSIINNKAMHDFFSQNGLEVINLKGEIWKQYGDGQFDRPEQQWRQVTAYDSIITSRYSGSADRIINATAQSLYEVWQAFEEARKGNRNSLIEQIPSQKKQLTGFFIEHFKALSLIPLPYQSDLDSYEFKETELPKLEDVNRRIKNRNFIRSRVANSFMIAYGRYNRGEGINYAEFRFKFSTRGWYDDSPHKKGTLDFWFGPVFAYAVGHREFFSEIDFHQFRIGPSATLDVWVSDSRYFGIYSYLDVGLQTRGGITKFLFGPSLGLQPGPLIGLDNFALPQWIWLPLRFLIPLKIRGGVDIVPGQRPNYQIVGDIDILF